MCGLTGIIQKNGDKAAFFLYLMMLHLLHRGKESAGMVTQGESPFDLCVHGALGEVPQVFNKELLAKLRGHMGIGQTRYSTTGDGSFHNIPPIVGYFKNLPFAIAHNGNLVNTISLKRELGIADEGMSDTRVIALLLSKSRKETFENALLEVLQKIKGAFCLLILFNGTLYAIRDPYGFHPLQYVEHEDRLVIASESCVFDCLHIKERITEVGPGEMVLFKNGEIVTQRWNRNAKLTFDIFEFIYFLRPDSIVHGISVHKARVAMGRRLAQEHPVEADVVIPVCDSGNEAAWGYARESGIPLEFGLFRPHIVSRTFIEPIAEEREKFLAHLKFNTIPELIRGKRVIVVDDSIVRSATIRSVNRLLRDAGAKSVAARISSPPYLYPDFYGIDTYRKNNELAARIHGGNTSAIASDCGLDDLKYLSLEGVKRAIVESAPSGSDITMESFYTGPFTGQYPAGSGDYAKYLQ